MKKGILIALGILVGVWVAGIISANFFDYDPAQWWEGKKSGAQAGTKYVKPEGWKTYRYEDLKFSMDSPVTLMEKKPDDTVAQMMGNKVSIKSLMLMGLETTPKFFNVVVTVMDLPGLPAQAVTIFDPAAQMEKTFNVLKAMGTFKDLQPDIHPVTLTGAQGTLGEATTEMPNVGPYKIRIFGAREGSLLVNVMLQYASNEEADARADGILQSIKFPL